jgi:hypothetical protein
MKTVKAVLIDSEHKTLSEIQLVDPGEHDHLEELYRVLKCRRITSGAHLGGTLEDGFDSIFVSDDDLENRDDPRFWFRVDADRNPPSSFPIAGLGLAHGTNREGAMCDVKISVAELAKRITFTQRKFKGFSVTAFDPTKQHGLVRPLVQVDVIAPIIDGTEEKL